MTTTTHKVPMYVWLPEDVSDDVRVAATEAGVSLSAMVEQALREKLDGPSPQAAVDAIAGLDKRVGRLEEMAGVG